eukprot:GHVL01033337.1.p1 GENE.GHVL01033337.1~~GHVL01033337.1.p1  ORF type:complete len:668 (-),score=96.31 GHVL01033337.1:3838-5841(-)
MAIVSTHSSLYLSIQKFQQRKSSSRMSVDNKKSSASPRAISFRHALLHRYGEVLHNMPEESVLSEQDMQDLTKNSTIPMVTPSSEGRVDRFPLASESELVAQFSHSISRCLCDRSKKSNRLKRSLVDSCKPLKNGLNKFLHYVNYQKLNSTDRFDLLTKQQRFQLYLKYPHRILAHSGSETRPPRPNIVNTKTHSAESNSCIGGTPVSTDEFHQMETYRDAVHRARHEWLPRCVQKHPHDEDCLLEWQEQFDGLMKSVNLMDLIDPLTFQEIFDNLDPPRHPKYMKSCMITAPWNTAERFTCETCQGPLESNYVPTTRHAKPVNVFLPGRTIVRISGRQLAKANNNVSSKSKNKGSAQNDEQSYTTPEPNGSYQAKLNGEKSVKKQKTSDSNNELDSASTSREKSPGSKTVALGEINQNEEQKLDNRNEALLLQNSIKKGKLKEDGTTKQKRRTTSCDTDDPSIFHKKNKKTRRRTIAEPHISAQVLEVTSVLNEKNLELSDSAVSNADSKKSGLSNIKKKKRKNCPLKQDNSECPSVEIIEEASDDIAQQKTISQFSNSNGILTTLDSVSSQQLEDSSVIVLEKVDDCDASMVGRIEDHSTITVILEGNRSVTTGESETKQIDEIDGSLTRENDCDATSLKQNFNESESLNQQKQIVYVSSIYSNS